MSFGVHHRHGLDPMLLWLCCWLAATAPIRPLAWESPYATSVALKNQQQKKGYYKQLHPLKFDNLDDMNLFFKDYQLIQLNIKYIN